MTDRETIICVDDQGRKITFGGFTKRHKRYWEFLATEERKRQLPFGRSAIEVCLSALAKQKKAAR